MRELHSAWTRVLVVPVIAAVGLGLTFVGASLPATASAACSTKSPDYGKVGAKEDARLSTGPFSRGNRSLMHAGNTDTCQRVSSIYIQSPNQEGFIEFGWVAGLSKCTGTTNTVIRLFYWVENERTGVDHCKVFPTTNPESGGSAVYRIDDTNATTTWNAMYNKTAIQTGIDVDFSRGWPVVGMERGASNDSGYALWDELFEFHDKNGWTSWEHPSELVDSDPDYDYKRYSVDKLASEVP